MKECLDSSHLHCCHYRVYRLSWRLLKANSERKKERKSGGWASWFCFLLDNLKINLYEVNMGIDGLHQALYAIDIQILIIVTRSGAVVNFIRRI